MPSPILARADALMQRRRQPGEADDVPILTDTIEENDGIPVLTETDGLSGLPADTPTLPPQQEHALDPALIDLLSHELARRVEQRLASELPRIIESTVRDFLAEQEMIAAQWPRD